MDVSWRTEMSNLPRRKSTEESSLYRKSFTGYKLSDPNDYDDVFGGPPRTVLSRNSSRLFYEEIFRQPEKTTTPTTKSCRNLPAFRIPLKRNGGKEQQRSEEFYSDIFGSDDDVRFSSKSNTKSTSSSVLSSDNPSPFRQANVDDPALNIFVSKLRALNVPSRWNSSIGMPTECPEEQTWRDDFQTNPNSNINIPFMETCYSDSAKFGFSRQVPSPESISIHQHLFGRSGKVSGNDIEETISPLSGISSVFNEHTHDKGKMTQDSVMQDQERLVVDDNAEDVDDDADEVMSTYVIEINSGHRCEEAISVDDAIAWARERYQTQCPDVPSSKSQETAAPDGIPITQHTDGLKESHFLMKVDMKMELLDEDIRVWSAGKEANIRFLLSTLHHILWKNSGWCEIPILSLIQAHCVKKAYQKARLCLHPDKLQQRGATTRQKYIAEKAFSILQDAWTVFLTEFLKLAPREICIAVAVVVVPILVLLYRGFAFIVLN